jgi:hypothetical protein
MRMRPGKRDEAVHVPAATPATLRRIEAQLSLQLLWSGHASFAEAADVVFANALADADEHVALQ